MCFAHNNAFTPRLRVRVVNPYVSCDRTVIRRAAPPRRPRQAVLAYCHAPPLHPICNGDLRCRLS